MHNATCQNYGSFGEPFTSTSNTLLLTEASGGEFRRGESMEGLYKAQQRTRYVRLARPPLGNSSPVATLWEFPTVS